MKKIISLLAACTLFAVCLPVSAADAVTEDSALLQNSVVEQTDPYTFYFVPERTYVSAEEVQAGDVHIPTKVYIKGNTQPIKQITGARIRYQSDSSSLYFSNSSNILSTTDMYKQSYSGGSFFSEYAMPTCFGEITSSGTYTPYSCAPLTSALLTEPFSGSSIRSDGAGGIYFTRSYNKLVDGVKTWISNEKIEIPASDLQQNADGTVSFTYSYYKQSAEEQYPLETNTCTIPHYDATLPAGTVLSGYHDAYSWILTGTHAQEGVSFLGYADEFPFFSFDIVIRQGTPNDVYTVSFSETDCSLSTAAHTRLPLSFVSTSITVGASSATITNDTSKLSTICAFAENDRPLTLSQYSNAAITGRVTYTDNVTKNESLLDALTAQTTPAALYAAATTTGYAIADVPFYCGDATAPVYQFNAAPYTKKVLVGKKGDSNLDGIVDVNDSVCILTYYAKKAAGNTAKLNNSFTDDQETLAYFLSDIDTCSQNQGADGGVLGVEDAVQILTHYAKSASGNTPIWNNWW